MARRENQWGVATLALAGALLAQQPAAAQFNPYAIPRFNPLGPANPVMPFVPNPVTSVNPAFLGPYDPYNTLPYNPYYGIGPTGGALLGLADLTRAQGTYVINMEQARTMREQAIQAKLDTQRRRFELQMYIKANTPTFTEEQTRIARSTLNRIHSHSMPSEISNGTALNLMLDDARKFPSRKIVAEQITLSEDILQRLNVTGSQVGVGALRDGQIRWTLAVQETVPAEQLKKLDAQASILVQAAAKGAIDPNLFRDFTAELDKTYDSLVSRVNELAGAQYLEAKRFLSDLKDARLALEKGELQRQLQFQKFIAGGKSIQDVVDFMISKGLRFAPATGQDEAAYRAFYSALVAFDVALNSQGQTPLPDSKDSK